MPGALEQHGDGRAERAGADDRGTTRMLTGVTHRAARYRPVSARRRVRRRASALAILGTRTFAEEVSDLVEQTGEHEVVAFVENWERERAGRVLDGRPVIWVRRAGRARRRVDSRVRDRLAGAARLRRSRGGARRGLRDRGPPRGGRGSVRRARRRLHRLARRRDRRPTRGSAST